MDKSSINASNQFGKFDSPDEISSANELNYAIDEDKTDISIENPPNEGQINFDGDPLTDEYLTIEEPSPARKIHTKSILCIFLVVLLILGGIYISAYVIPADINKLNEKNLMALSTSSSVELTFKFDFDIQEKDKNHTYTIDCKLFCLKDSAGTSAFDNIYIKGTFNQNTPSVSSAPFELKYTRLPDGIEIESNINGKYTNRRHSGDEITNEDDRAKRFKSKEEYEQFIGELGKYITSDFARKNMTIVKSTQGFDFFKRTTNFTADANAFLDFFIKDADYNEMLAIFNAHAVADKQLTVTAIERIKRIVDNLNSTNTFSADLLEFQNFEGAYITDFFGNLKSQSFSLTVKPNIEKLLDLLSCFYSSTEIDSMTNLNDSADMNDVPVSNISAVSPGGIMSNSILPWGQYCKDQHEKSYDISAISSISADFSVTYDAINKITELPKVSQN